MTNTSQFMLKIPMGSIADLQLFSTCDRPIQATKVTLVTPDASYTQTYTDPSPIVEVDTTRLSLGPIRAKIEYALDTPRGLRVVIKVVDTPYEVVDALV